MVVVALVATACGSSGDDSAGPPDDGDAPTIVVTHAVLGAAVADLVGDAAEVEVVMPNGIDPHDFQPSAREIAAVGGADLVVANGLDLEEGLTDALEQAEADGVPVFYATDHVDVRRFGEGEVAPDDEHADDESGDAPTDVRADDDPDHGGAGAADPHFWVDPASMAQVVAALGPVVTTELGVEVAGRAADLEDRLADLDAATEQTLAVVPADRRKLVTGHESMGYFARRYDFALVGALVPATTSQAAPSAGELSELAEQIEREQVPVVFTEVGTPPALAEAIADETGAEVVELTVHALPDDGSYATFIDEIASTVASALAPTG
jgi:zinc/manganese transport system substrate-binding protein